MMLKLIFLFTFLALVASAKFRFDNYTLYRIIPQNIEGVELLQELCDKDQRFDFWSNPMRSFDPINVLSSPENKAELENLLKTSEVKVEIAMENIQDAIDKENIKSYTKNNMRTMQWDAYYDLDGIYSWLDDLAVAYPSVASIIIGGDTYEGRQIKGIKISHGGGRKAIFVEGGLHAREWISPATVNFMTNELLTSVDEDTKAAAHDYDWYIFPVTNPDGYVWSHEGFRLWRKNRRPIGAEFGVDLNRNWNSNWLVEGASTDPATDVYAGLGPFSEVETRTLSTYIRSIADMMDLYLSFHSSGQLLLIPFGNTTEPLANYYDAMNIGRRAMGALSVRYGTEYTTGNIAEAIYHATGSAVDWVKEHLNTPLVYCYELRDRGTYGHLLPADQILPTSEETLDSVLDILHQAERFGYMNSGVGLKSPVLVIVLVLPFVMNIMMWF